MRLSHLQLGREEPTLNPYGKAMDDVEVELTNAVEAWPPMNSAHEAYGVLQEEVDEFKAIVFQKQKNRDLQAMRKELIQIAAVALRSAAEVCDELRGRK